MFSPGSRFDAVSSVEKDFSLPCHRPDSSRHRTRCTVCLLSLCLWISDLNGRTLLDLCKMACVRFVLYMLEREGDVDLPSLQNRQGQFPTSRYQVSGRKYGRPVMNMVHSCFPMKSQRVYRRSAGYLLIITRVSSPTYLCWARRLVVVF